VTISGLGDRGNFTNGLPVVTKANLGEVNNLRENLALGEDNQKWQSPVKLEKVDASEKKKGPGSICTGRLGE